MRRRARLGVAVAAAALAAAPTARAADERPALIARALAHSPVYVSDSLARVAPAAQVRALRAEVARDPFGAYVAVVPIFDKESGVESPQDLLSVLHDRLGRDGVYVAADESGIFLAAAAYGARTRYRPDRVDLAALEDVPLRAGPVARARYALALMRTGRRAPHARRFPAGALTALGAVAVFVPLTLRRRRRRPGARPRGTAVPADAEAQARAARDALARALAAAPDAPEHAFRLHDAASKATDEARQAIDWVGVLVLARAGLAAAAGRAATAPCFFNPLHGDGEARTWWALGGRRAELPACRACAAAVADGAAPSALLDRGRPYWERDTLWARTGFGALDEDLADRVLAGAAWH